MAQPAEGRGLRGPLQAELETSDKGTRAARPVLPPHGAGMDLQSLHDPNTCLGTPEAPVHPADPWAHPALQRYPAASLHF